MIRKFILLISLVLATKSYAWNDEATHPTLSEYAAEKYFGADFMVRYINGVQVKKYIRDGAKLEDAGTKWQFINGTARSLNHFHVPTITNPTKNTLETAGLSDRATGMSAVRWAQSGTYQMELGWDDWSWQKVREHYYNYLTATIQTDEDVNLARTLMGLGYQMHLVQDMGHPSHVRNNTHILDGAGWKGFETWAAKNDLSIIRPGILDKKDAAGNYLYPVPQVAVDLTVNFDNTHNLAPVARLFDTRTYLGTNTPTTLFSQGLAEYTNGNFFSQDTIFAAERFGSDTSYKYYFPYPRKSGTDAQQYIDGINADYISKTGEGETITHLARSGVMSRFLLNILGEGKRFYGSFKLDEECYLDYAQKLIPASVGYSKAMLDYFFRGSLEVSLPANTQQTRRRIQLNVKNTTPGEAMNSGSIELVAIVPYYKKSDNLASNTLVPAETYEIKKYAYRQGSSTCSRETPVCGISTDTMLLDFDLGGDPLTLAKMDSNGKLLLARDISLVLVYRGKLGNEPDSVAFKEIFVDGLTDDIDLSLPASGVYAAVNGESTANSFTDIAVAAQNSLSPPSQPGSAEILLMYQVAQSDPFQGQEVITSDDVYYTSVIVPTPQGIPSQTTVEFAAALTAGLPVTATDVHAHIINTDSNGVITHGYRDISEPTPVDVYNNTDYSCIAGQWYPSGTSAAITAADQLGNRNGRSDETDLFPHSFTNIYDKLSPAAAPVGASATTFTFQEPGPLNTGAMKRLGYVLTDYTFKYSFLKTWNHIAPDDGWTTNETAMLFDGTAVKNQTDAEGNYSYPGMYNMRGSLMWWGASRIFDNIPYPNGNLTCQWSQLPLP